MRLTLTLTDGLDSERGRLHVVEDIGPTPFVIGRDPSADLTVIEPTNQLSRRHVALRLDNGKLLVTSLTQSSWTALNTRANRLQQDQPTPVDDTCTLILPVGAIGVEVERPGGRGGVFDDEAEADDIFGVGELANARSSSWRTQPRRADDRRAPDLLDGGPKRGLLDDVSTAETGGGLLGDSLPNPSDLLGGGGPSGGARPSRPAPTDDRPRARAEVSLPPVQPAPTPAPAPHELNPDVVRPKVADPAPAAPPAQGLPDGWLDDEEEDAIFGPGTEEAPATPVQITAPPPPEPVAEPAAPPPPEPVPTPPEVDAEAVAPSPADLAGPAAGPVPAPPPAGRGPTTQIPTAPPPPEPAPSAPIDDAALEAFLAELGESLAGIPEDQRREFVVDIARTFAAMAEAMRQMLDTRAEVKRALGVVATEVELGANPLKTVRDRRAAVDGLLRPLTSGYLSGEAAVDDALRSMQAHQYALVGGIKAAVKTVLEQFDPAALEEKLQTGTLGSLMPSVRKAALWEAFSKDYREFCEQAEENFRVVIGRELDKLYQTERARLAGQRTED